MSSCRDFDKIIPFIAYDVFGYLIFRCFAGCEDGTFPQRHPTILTIGSGFFSALTAAWPQYFGPGRDP
jgi:hypothetical protein